MHRTPREDVFNRRPNGPPPEPIVDEVLAVEPVEQVAAKPAMPPPAPTPSTPGPGRRAEAREPVRELAPRTAEAAELSTETKSLRIEGNDGR